MSEQITPTQNIGIGIFMLPAIFCGMEMIPGWGILKLGWPREAFYGIMAVCGAISGVLIARYRVPGFVSGALAGFGSLYAIAYVLEGANRTNAVVLTIAALIGVLPSIPMYLLLRYPFRRAEPSPDEVAGKPEQEQLPPDGDA